MSKEQFRNKKKAGILGATGHVGRKAAETLLESGKYQVILGVRSVEKAEEQFGKQENLEYIQADIFKQDQLDEFVQQCDIVLNCAGPSYLIQDTVLKSCLKANVHYVDPAGGKKLSQFLSSNKEEWKESNVLRVISAGTFPGLTEIFTKYCLENLLDETLEATLFFCGEGVLSYNAISDIGNEIEQTESSQQREKQKFLSEVHFPEINKTRCAYQLEAPDFEQVCQENDVEEFHLYNTYPDILFLQKLMEIAEATAKREESKRSKLLRELQGYYEDSANEELTFLSLEQKGYQDGVYCTKRKSILIEQDWNKFTGVVAAGITAFILEQKTTHSSGNFRGYEMVDSNEFFNWLKKFGLMEL